MYFPSEQITNVSDMSCTSDNESVNFVTSLYNVDSEEHILTTFVPCTPNSMAPVVLQHTSLANSATLASLISSEAPFSKLSLVSLRD